jgi:hypothetical protein
MADCLGVNPGQRFANRKKLLSISRVVRLPALVKSTRQKVKLCLR